MKLTAQERNAVIQLKIAKADKTFDEAQGIASLGYWPAVGNRLYYAAYHIVSALLISEGYEAHTHSGVIHLFGIHFVVKGKVSKESGKLYSKLYDLRLTGDYDDVYIVSKEDVEHLLPMVSSFLKEIRMLIA